MQSLLAGDSAVSLDDARGDAAASNGVAAFGQGALKVMERNKKLQAQKRAAERHATRRGRASRARADNDRLAPRARLASSATAGDESERRGRR